MPCCRNNCSSSLVQPDRSSRGSNKATSQPSLNWFAQRPAAGTLSGIQYRAGAAGERLSNTIATISANQTLYDENLRVRKALDGASTNVMIADTNLDIVYMNEAVLAMLGQAESDIRKDLPNFDVRQLMGKNIDTFHKDPPISAACWPN